VGFPRQFAGVIGILERALGMKDGVCVFTFFVLLRRSAVGMRRKLVLRCRFGAAAGGAPGGGAF